MPKTQAADLKWRFANGLSDYNSMVEQIETYSQHLRHESAYGRGEADDRMVDLLSKGQYSGDWLDQATGAEVAAFYEGMQEGTVSTAKEMPEMHAEDLPIDLMYKKGKGKGKGRRGPPQGGGKGRDRDSGAHAGKGQGNGKFCKHCLTKNHDESECRKKAAGMSASDARRTRPARSLEHAQAQLDLVNGKAPQGDWVEQMADRQTGSLDREAYVFEFELDASEFQGTEWVQEEDSPPSGASSSGLIPRLETPEYVRSALARELLAEPRFEDAAQCYTPATDSKCEATRVLPHPARAITGPKYFSALAALEEQEEADPWTSQDPWTRVESITGSADSLPPLSAEFARQNAELDASRLDIVSLFTTRQVSGGLPAPTDEPGKGETPERKVKRTQFSISTPDTGSEGRTRRFDGWNRRKVDASTSPIAPPWNDSSLPNSSPGSVPVRTLSAPSGSNVFDHTYISSDNHVFDTAIDISSSILIDYPNVFSHIAVNRF